MTGYRLAPLVVAAAILRLAAVGAAGTDTVAAARSSYAGDPRQGHFYGIEVGETNVIFLLDCSGSMRGGRIERLRGELAAALDGMDDSMRFVVIPFGGLDMLMCPSTGMESATEVRREQARRFIERRRAEGRTPMLGVIRKAFSHVVRRQTAATGPVDAVYLLSDGEATDAKSDDLLVEVGRLNAADRVKIHAISIGVDSELLRELAGRNGGKYRFVPDERR